MKFTAGLLIFILFASFSFAQHTYLPGYIITIENDTLIGRIHNKVKPGGGKVKFLKEDGKKKTFYPRQINAFVINDSTKYQSILQTENADAANYQIFALLVVDGYLKLLATQNKTGSILSSKDETQKGSTYNFYVQESLTGKYYKLTKVSYKNQLADRINDYTELRREVRNKVYNYNEIPEVIEKYNVWKDGRIR